METRTGLQQSYHSQTLRPAQPPKALQNLDPKHKAIMSAPLAYTQTRILASNTLSSGPIERAYELLSS